MSVEKYECSLSEKSIKIAKKELNEDPKERLGAIQAFKEWIERESWINAPTDPYFLLSFLRYGKFSQLRARDRITNFMSYFSSEKSKYTFMRGHDPGNPRSLEIFSEGTVLILPGTDKSGRRVILSRPGAIDPKRYSFEEYCQAIIPLLHLAMFSEEEPQVNGTRFIYDYGGIGMNLISWSGIESLRQHAEFISKAYPARIKAADYFSVGPVFEAIFAIYKPFLSEKIRKRIKIHHSLVPLYNEIDMSCLPEEYLPDDYGGPTAGTCRTIAEKNIQEFYLNPKMRGFLKELYSGKYGADLTKKPTGTEAAASFRQLNVS